MVEPRRPGQKGRGRQVPEQAYGAWPDKDTEPAEVQLKHELSGLKGQGKCTLWATPYSNTPIYFDDLKIEVEAAAKK